MAVIAIDCDDTLSRTNETICRWHNQTYGSDLRIRDFTHFQYWRLPAWGDREEAQRKVKAFNRSQAWDEIPVVDASVAGVHALKAMGHQLVIVTARMASEADRTRDWVERTYGRDTFREIYFTSAFESRAAADPEGQDRRAAMDGPESVASRHHLQYISLPLPKSEVCKRIGAAMLVDDSIENAYEVNTNAGIPVALYGDWQWNKRTVHADRADDPRSYQQRLDAGDVEDETEAVLPPGVHRALRWDDVVALAKELL